LGSREWSDQIPEDEKEDDLESMFMSVLRRMNEDADENEGLPQTVVIDSTIPNDDWISYFSH
jgi:excinuclease UvrABC nuclease subunit